MQSSVIGRLGTFRVGFWLLIGGLNVLLPDFSEPQTRQHTKCKILATLLKGKER